MNQRGYYSRKVRAGKRTYFFDVRATRNGDFFMTITESKKKHKDSGFDNHKVFIYKEDFHKFIHALKEGLEHIHTELNELDVQDINEVKHTIEVGVKEEEPSAVELSDDLNRAIDAKNEENPQSW
ncbi:MAG: DUF3276 family protein [Bacteroidota bacterium]|nr:DUF3276 family protein [Bacteroidota bacterium]MEC8835003.1 DUF3276 family protein [Bacteroidota bacterium]